MRKWLLQQDDHVNVVVANITRVIMFTSSGPWLEVELGESQTPSSWLRFKFSEARYYVPLGWNEWSVARWISLPINNAH